MDDFKKQVSDIKLWGCFMWAGIAVLFVSYVPLTVIRSLDMFFGLEITLKLPAFFMVFMMNMFLFGWAIGAVLIILAAAGTGKRRICSRCGKNLKIKDFEKMPDRFLCPYCLNDKINNSSIFRI